MKKHTLLKSFLVTLVVMLLAACQNDESGIKPENDAKLNTLPFKIKNLGADWVPDGVHGIVNNKITFYNNSFASNKSTSVENITVQNDSARVVELDNGKVSYTFKVESSNSYNQHYFENIVVVYPDSTEVYPTTYLVKYKLSEDQWSNYYSTGVLEFDPENVTSTLLSESEHDQIFNKNSSGCTFSTIHLPLANGCVRSIFTATNCAVQVTLTCPGEGDTGDGGGSGGGGGSNIPGGWLPDPDAPLPGPGTGSNNGGGGGSGSGTSNGNNDLPLDGSLLTSPYMRDLEDSEFIQSLNQIKDCLGPNLIPEDDSWLAQQSDEFVQELAGLMDDCDPASSPYESIWEAVEYLFSQKPQMEINFIKDNLYTDEEIEITYEEYIEFVELHHFTDSEREIYDNELSYYERFEYLHSGLIAKEMGVLVQPELLINCRNGNGDAVQHAMWNARGKIFIDVETMHNLTTAHEENNLIAHPLESEMDLHNNSVGLNTTVNLIDVKVKVLYWLVSGQLKKIHPTGDIPNHCGTIGDSQIINTP